MILDRLAPIFATFTAGMAFGLILAAIFATHDHRRRNRP